ncbi:GNAT family N-acetyltransferase [Lentibacillus saliphilus]|uniref:GNAT family N-acetyltransferase n=1 Tax=Lentibacillus saliphilus TaxID=2737028 RepID=UPI001C2F6384|nr:GNAT family protein [Lentibacillus saliphilus]
MFNVRVDDDIVVRMFQMSEAEAIYNLVDQSRDYLREWLPWVDYITGPEQYDAFIQQSFEQYNNQKGLTAGIFYRGELAGVTGFNELDAQHRIAKIGYWIGVQYQGQGIMTRVVEKLIDYAFNDLDFNRVEIRAAVANHKSRAIPERLGFTEEGTIRDAEWLYDHYVDHVIYGILASEWRQDVTNFGE